MTKLLWPTFETRFGGNKILSNFAPTSLTENIFTRELEDRNRILEANMLTITLDTAHNMRFKVSGVWNFGRRFVVLVNSVLRIEDQWFKSRLLKAQAR